MDTYASNRNLYLQMCILDAQIFPAEKFWQSRAY